MRSAEKRPPPSSSRRSCNSYSQSYWWQVDGARAKGECRFSVVSCARIAARAHILDMRVSDRFATPCPYVTMHSEALWCRIASHNRIFSLYRGRASPTPAIAEHVAISHRTQSFHKPLVTDISPYSRKHYFLVAEGWIYFILTLLDLLAHQINSARDSISTFRVFDIVIGALWFSASFASDAYHTASPPYRCFLIPTHTPLYRLPLHSDTEFFHPLYPPPLSKGGAVHSHDIHPSHGRN